MPDLPPAADPFWWADPRTKPALAADPRAVLRGYGVNAPAELPLEAVHDVLRIVGVVWVDGFLQPREQFHLDPADEGLLYGRGVWESTRTFGGVPWLWADHLDRLRETAALVGIDLTPHQLPDAAKVTEYVRILTPTDVTVRLNVSAGRPGAKGRVWMTAALRPVPRAAARLQCRPSPIPAGFPHLTWKTFQYVGRHAVSRAATAAGFDGALLTDPAGNLLEADCANIFVRLADGWATPPAAGDLFLPGTVRRHLLAKSPVPIRERAVPRAALPDVREAFMTNSNLGLVPVTRIDDRELPVGDETLAIGRFLQPR